MVLIVAGVLTVGAALYCGASLLAQAPQPAAQPPAAQQAPAQTRVAFVNLHIVLKNYKKTKIYDDEVERIVKPLRDKGEEAKSNIKKAEEALRDVKLDPTLRAQHEKSGRDWKRYLEDLEIEANKLVGKKREEQLVQLYHEIEDAVGRYAAANGFTAVLQYTEPETAAEKYSAQNIQRKLAGSSQTGCTVPIYFHPGLDISAAVIANLNAPYQPGTNTGG
jgi:Skp family chaperone for outer membrane proteins